MHENEDRIKELEDLVNRTITSVSKTAELGMIAQEIQLIFFITEMCLRYGKKPKEIIKLMTKIKEELNHARSLL